MKTINAVIYARYSSHGQSQQSIEGQLRDAYAYAEQMGYTVIAEYIDRALTARTDNRADFQRMISDSAKHQFTIVLVWKLDRFARNRYDSAIYKARLKKQGVRVISVKENLTDSPEGIILEGMLESMAEYYSANLAVNVKRGQRETLIKGKFCGGKVPYGYKSVDGKLELDEKAVPTVRYIFEQYAQGTSKSDLIKLLNDKGVKSPRGLDLTINSFYYMLRNPIYAGHYTRANVVYDDIAPAIVDDDLFDKVQKRLKLTARAPASAKAKVEYLLQGKAFCGCCGSRMNGESGKSRNGTQHHYYSCINRKKKHTCKKIPQRKEQAQTFVVQRTVNYILVPKNITAIAKAVVAEYDREFATSKQSELEHAISRVEYELNKLVDALIDAPKITHARIYEKMENLQAQKTDLTLQLDKLRIAAKIRYTTADVEAWIKQFTNGDINDPEYCKRIIDVFVNSVYFYDDRIVIFYNSSNAHSEHPLLSDVTKATEPSPGSDMNANVPPLTFKSEPRYVMINGVIGFVFYSVTHG